MRKNLLKLAVTTAISLSASWAIADDGFNPKYKQMMSADGVPMVSTTSGFYTKDTFEKAMGIHKRVHTLDTHDDIPFYFMTDQVDPGIRGYRQVTLPKMREGGLDIGFFIVFIPQTERTAENYQIAKDQSMNKFNSIHKMVNTYSDQIEFAYTAADVERIRAKGKLVATIGIENGYAIAKDISLLEKYHKLGARYMTLAHNGHNDIADSSRPSDNEGPSEHDGVSPFGEEVIAEMNRLGIMVDVSHTSKASTLDATRLSKAPVIASHSGAKAIHDVARNMTDEEMIAVKNTGGLVNMVGLAGYVTDVSDEKWEEIYAIRAPIGLKDHEDVPLLAPDVRAKYVADVDALNKKYPATVKQFVDHIDYAVNLLGVDYVGISSDFDGGGGILGWDDASETYNLTLEMVHRGYTEDQIAKIWSGNMIRVWSDVEKVAAEIQGN